MDGCCLFPSTHTQQLSHHPELPGPHPSHLASMERFPWQIFVATSRLPEDRLQMVKTGWVKRNFLASILILMSTCDFGRSTPPTATSNAMKKMIAHSELKSNNSRASHNTKRAILLLAGWLHDYHQWSTWACFLTWFPQLLGLRASYKISQHPAYNETSINVLPLTNTGICFRYLWRCLLL